jgi:D-alanyl-D-alanine carboxypeptidase (penicillin-binding protein 5/6)
VFAKIVSTQLADFPGFAGKPGFMLSNDNRLLRDYPGALGGKTGFTDDARHTYIGAAQRDGRRLVVVLMRGEQLPVRMSEQAARLLDYGFALTGEPVGELVEAAPEPPPANPSQPQINQAVPGAIAASEPSEPSGSGRRTAAVVAVVAGLTVLAATLMLLFLARRRRASVAP